MNLKKVFDDSISEKKKQRKMALKVVSSIGSNVNAPNNVYTFGIVTAQNPNSESMSSSYNKKANKSLLHTLKEWNYVSVPIKGHFKGNTENSYLIINISLDKLRQLSGMYNQTSFCFGNTSEGFVEYWEKDDAEIPYDKITNNYIRKDSVDYTQRLDKGEENYSLIGKNFKFTFPFKIFDSVSKKIQDNVDKYFNGDNGIVEWCMNHVGYASYEREKKLYNNI